MLRRWWHALDPLFPEQEIFQRRLSLQIAAPVFIVLTIMFSFVASHIPADGFFRFDWDHFFGAQIIPPYYPPWTIQVVSLLNYPVLIGITLAAFGLAVYQRAVHPLSLAAAFLSLPLLWTVFLGQIEGLTILGMLGLPWLVPLVLVKPQISLFSLGARRSYILAFCICLIISLVIWGNWPEVMYQVNSFKAEGRYPQNIGLGWYGLPLFLLTIWFSRGDMDMMMASGAFLTPYLIFYNLLPLTPAVARLKPRSAWIALFLSFLTFSSNWLGPGGWWLGWGFVPWLWLNLALLRYPEAAISKKLRWITG